jgi:hypothetical protein
VKNAQHPHILYANRQVVEVQGHHHGADYQKGALAGSDFSTGGQVGNQTRPRQETQIHYHWNSNGQCLLALPRGYHIFFSKSDELCLKTVAFPEHLNILCPSKYVMQN